jgi:hypothetical protein
MAIDVAESAPKQDFLRTRHDRQAMMLFLDSAPLQATWVDEESPITARSMTVGPRAHLPASGLAVADLQSTGN